MSTSITVQLNPEVETSRTRVIASLERELGVSIRPMHPGTDDATLGSYFTVDVPNSTSAEEVAARLRDSPAIAAAYVKPPDAMP